MKCHHYIAVFGVLLIYLFILLAAYVIVPSGHFHTVIDIFTSLGTIAAVLFALYGDFLRAWFYPVDLIIETLPRNESDQTIQQTNDGPTHKEHYCHHLRVRNVTRAKLVTNCRVWLKRVSVKKGDSQEEIIAFAVPRMMAWAPSEYSSDVRTFITTQLFDLGNTIERGFNFTIHTSQKAAENYFKEIKGKFEQETVIKCVLYATADNYYDEREFCFAITAGCISHVFSTVKEITDKSQFPSLPKIDGEFSHWVE